MQTFIFETLLKSRKWLINCSYNLNKIYVATHLGEIYKALDTYNKKFENTLLMEDFNVELDAIYMKAFRNKYKLKSLNKEPSYSKNFD